MKCAETLFRASVEREFNLGSAQVKDDNKVINFSALAVASVARNFYGITSAKRGQ